MLFPSAPEKTMFLFKNVTLFPTLSVFQYVHEVEQNINSKGKLTYQQWERSQSSNFQGLISILKNPHKQANLVLKWYKLVELCVSL